MSLSVQKNLLSTFNPAGGGNAGTIIFGCLSLDDKVVAARTCKLFANFYRARCSDKDQKELAEQRQKYVKIYGEGFFEIISMHALRKLPILDWPVEYNIRGIDEQMQKQNINLARLNFLFAGCFLVARINVLKPKSKHLMVFNLKSFTTWTFTKTGLNSRSEDHFDELDEPRRRFLTQLIEGRPCFAPEFGITMNNMSVKKSFFSSERVPNIHLVKCEKQEKKSDKKDKVESKKS